MGESFVLELERLEHLLLLETEALRHVRFEQLPEFSRRKHQALLALQRLDRPPADVSTQRALTRVRRVLAANHAALHAQLSAIEEVADVLVAAIEDAEWDGTYHPNFREPA